MIEMSTTAPRSVGCERTGQENTAKKNAGDTAKELKLMVTCSL